jgi:hypothetical protein
MQQDDPLPHSWDVTSDSIAAWVCGAVGADRLILVKPPGAVGGSLTDAYFQRALPAWVRAVIVTADEYCEDGGSGIRTDYFQDWIDDTMAGGGGFENCDLLGGDCTSGACFPVDDGVRDCVPSEGAALGAACDPDPEHWGDALPCDDGLICLTGEEEGTGECYEYCTDEATCAEEETCFKPLFEDADLQDVGVCVPVPPECGITAHECPAETACYPTTEGPGGCFPSDGLELGADCDPNASESLPCGDGLICVPVSEDGNDGMCFSFCLEDGDCDETDVCYAPIFSDVDDIGVCTCRDDDETCGARRPTATTAIRTCIPKATKCVVTASTTTATTTPMKAAIATTATTTGSARRMTATMAMPTFIPMPPKPVVMAPTTTATTGSMRHAIATRRMATDTVHPPTATTWPRPSTRGAKTSAVTSWTTTATGLSTKPVADRRVPMTIRTVSALGTTCGDTVQCAP